MKTPDFGRKKNLITERPVIATGGWMQIVAAEFIFREFAPIVCF
jgi:hypothetical protein